MNIDDLRIAFDGNGLFALQVALGIVMYGVALDLSLADLRSLTANPRSVAVGLFCQFLVLPAVAFGLTFVVTDVPSIALGLLLVASCPGGNVSNFLTQLSGGRVAVSVGMTACSTVLAVVSTPFNLTFWGGLNPSTAPLVQEVALDPVQVFQSVFGLLLLPVMMGMATRTLLPSVAAAIQPWLKRLSTAFLLLVIGIAVMNNIDIFAVAVGWVFVPVALLNATALGLGYGSSWLAGVDEGGRRAVMFEVGIQNSGLGLVLVFAHFEGLGGMAVVAAWWGIWHIVAGFTAVSFFRWRDRRLAS